MDPHDLRTITGRVTDVFAHRFVVETADGRILADLGPKGADAIDLRVGLAVELTGDMKPSELKVRRLVADGRTIEIEHGKGHGIGNPEVARRAVEAKGFHVVGAPRLKPKHAEILGRDATGGLFELHVEYDGLVRKSRPVPAHDPRWAAEIAA